jgi:hypothetical protein
VSEYRERGIYTRSGEAHARCYVLLKDRSPARGHKTLGPVRNGGHHGEIAWFDRPLRLHYEAVRFPWAGSVVRSVKANSRLTVASCAIGSERAPFGRRWPTGRDGNTPPAGLC